MDSPFVDLTSEVECTCWRPCSDLTSEVECAAQEKSVYHFGDAVMVVIGDNNICSFYSGFIGVAHCDSETGGLQHWDIVESITHCDSIFYGNAKYFAQVLKAGPF